MSCLEDSKKLNQIINSLASSLTRYVSRLMEYQKKPFKHLTTFLMSNCQGDCKNVQIKTGQVHIIAARGGTFSHMYGSTFWFVPLLPHVQFHFLSLNCLYLFSHMYSSIQICIPLSWPLLGSANTVQCQG